MQHINVPCYKKILYALLPCWLGSAISHGIQSSMGVTLNLEVANMAEFWRSKEKGRLEKAIHPLEAASLA
jgi:hypothetical protein